MRFGGKGNPRGTPIEMEFQMDEILDLLITLKHGLQSKWKM
jgi:hypothetical protein